MRRLLLLPLLVACAKSPAPSTATAAAVSAAPAALRTPTRQLAPTVAIEVKGSEVLVDGQPAAGFSGGSFAEADTKGMLVQPLYDALMNATTAAAKDRDHPFDGSVTLTAPGSTAMSVLLSVYYTAGQAQVGWFVLGDGLPPLANPNPSLAGQIAAVMVAANGTVRWVDGAGMPEPVKLGALSDELAASEAPFAVVSADPGARHDAVLAVLEELAAAGFSDVMIAGGAR